MAAVDQRRHNKSKMVSSRELDNLAGKATTETGYPQSMVSSDSEPTKKERNPTMPTVYHVCPERPSRSASPQALCRRSE